LYFINENYIRYSALESSLLIPADIHFIQFTWSEDRFDIDRVSPTKIYFNINHLFSILKPKLYYEYNTSSSNEHVLLPPVLNIGEKGIVPRDISSKNKINLNKKRGFFCCVIIAFSIFFPCLSSNRVNCSVLFRFYNSTKNSSSINIHIKFLKYCRDEIIDRSLLTQFYNSNQINDYLLIKECKFFYENNKNFYLKYSLYSARHRDFSSTTIATILAYSLIIALVVFLLVFFTAMSLFCIYRITTAKKKISEK
jgi:hypothetical protein